VTEDCPGDRLVGYCCPAAVLDMVHAGIRAALEAGQAAEDPVGDPRVPPATPWFVLEKPTGCVAAVEVEGSSFGRMAGRARDRASHVLRGLRIALGGRVHDRQPRFRLGIGYS
jgi:hypothetical protein